MERWEIRAAPSADDPGRHLLLLQGGMADVAALLKRFGSLCGRPSPHDGEGYNLSLVLHGVTPESRAKLDAWLSKVVPAAAAVPAPAPAPAPAPTPAPAPVSAPATPPPAALPPMPELKPPAAAPPPVLAPPGAAPAGIPSASDLPPPPAAPPGLAPVPAGPPAIPPAPASAPPALVSLSPEPAKPAVPPLAAPPPPAPGPAVSDFPTEVRMATPAAAAAPTVSAPAAAGGPRAVAPTEPLKAELNFDSLLVGAYNRFAHAAAMSVVGSPGTMYNPLFLYGVPGTGKTHMLHAIGGALSKGLGDATLMCTSGSRLSRAVSEAAAAKNFAELDKRAEGAKSLLVDDIHLLSITDQNKDYLAKLFKGFFDKNKQVVLTSLYPPRALGAIEEALKFSFSKGWSVDLKIPSPTVQKDLVASVSDRINAGLSADEIGLLHDKLSQWGYQDMGLWVRRLGALRKHFETVGKPGTLTDMLMLIYEPLVGAATEAGAPPAPPANFAPPTVSAAEAEPLAVIAPKGQDGLSTFAAAQFHEVGAKHGLKPTSRHALWANYDASQQVGVPFQIADLCQKAGVTRALVIGPGADSPLAARVTEFGHAVRRILESVGVQTGWVPYAGLQTQAHYLNAHLDFMK